MVLLLSVLPLIQVGIREVLPFKAVTARQQLPDFESTRNKCAWIIEVNEDSSPERKALIASAIERNYVPAGYIAGVCFNVKNPEAMAGSPDEITLFDALPGGIPDPLLDYSGNGSSPLQLLSVKADFSDDKILSHNYPVSWTT